MQLWFARNGSISIRDQLVTQLMLAIASGELAPGKRLPSTRALARRFQLHPNTVSAAYRRLQELGWVSPVHGSGVYVRVEQNDGSKAQVLDQLILNFVQAVKAAGVTANAIQARMNHWLNLRPRRFVFVHPEEGLRSIVCCELKRALAWEVFGVASDAGLLLPFATDSIFLTLPSNHSDVAAMLPFAAQVIPLQLHSVSDSLAPYLPIRPDLLIIVASQWPGFLAVAKTVLTAAGCDEDAVVFRDAHEQGWTNGMTARSVIVCDALTAAAIPDGPFKIVFALMSENAIAGIKTYERFYAE